MKKKIIMKMLVAALVLAVFASCTGDPNQDKASEFTTVRLYVGSDRPATRTILPQGDLRKPDYYMIRLVPGSNVKGEETKKVGPVESGSAIKVEGVKIGSWTVNVDGYMKSGADPQPTTDTKIMYGQKEATFAAGAANTVEIALDIAEGGKGTVEVGFSWSKSIARQRGPLKDALRASDATVTIKMEDATGLAPQNTWTSAPISVNADTLSVQASFTEVPSGKDGLYNFSVIAKDGTLLHQKLSAVQVYPGQTSTADETTGFVLTAAPKYRMGVRSNGVTNVLENSVDLDLVIAEDVESIDVYVKSNAPDAQETKQSFTKDQTKTVTGLDPQYQYDFRIRANYINKTHSAIESFANLRNISTKKHVKSISLSTPASTTLIYGTEDTVAFTVTVNPSDATDASYTWTEIPANLERVAETDTFKVKTLGRGQLIVMSNDNNEATATSANIDVVLAAPTNVVAAAGINKIDVTWNAVTGATGYDVFISSDNGLTFGPANHVSAASFTDENVVTGKTYVYKVVATHALVDGFDPKSAETKSNAIEIKEVNISVTLPTVQGGNIAFETLKNKTITHDSGVTVTLSNASAELGYTLRWMLNGTELAGNQNSVTVTYDSTGFDISQTVQSLTLIATHAENGTFNSSVDLIFDGGKIIFANAKAEPIRLPIQPSVGYDYDIFKVQAQSSVPAAFAGGAAPEYYYVVPEASIDLIEVDDAGNITPLKLGIATVEVYDTYGAKGSIQYEIYDGVIRDARDLVVAVNSDLDYVLENADRQLEQDWYYFTRYTDNDLTDANGNKMNVTIYPANANGSTTSIKYGGNINLSNRKFTPKFNDTATNHENGVDTRDFGEMTLNSGQIWIAPNGSWYGDNGNNKLATIGVTSGYAVDIKPESNKIKVSLDSKYGNNVTATIELKNINVTASGSASESYIVKFSHDMGNYENGAYAIKKDQAYSYTLNDLSAGQRIKIY